MIKAAVIGASGYAGLECLRLLAGHPDFEVAAATSRDLAGKKVTESFPALAGRPGGLDDLVFETPDPGALAGRADVFLTAVPHRSAMEMVPGLLDGGAKVVDLSADFRFTDSKVYAECMCRIRLRSCCRRLFTVCPSFIGTGSNPPD